MRPVLGIFISLGLAVPATAAIRPEKIQPQRLGHYMSEGFVTGGKSDPAGFSILKIESLEKGGVEKILITYGDGLGQKKIGTPGFFHASVETNPPRLVLDLAQVQRTAVEPKDLQRILVRSGLVAASDMTMDPEDKSTNITLMFRKPADVKFSSHKTDGASQLVIELRPKGAGR